MTWNDLVREYFPEATGEDIENILWSHTGFPCFWNIPREGDTPEECARKQLQELAIIVGIRGKLEDPITLEMRGFRGEAVKEGS